MKKFLLLAVAALGVLALLNTVAPAADVSERLQQSGEEEGYTDFFCLGDSIKEVALVRDTFVKYGDTITRAVADSLVIEGKCEYIQGVGWRADEEATECVLARSGHCIAVQKSYAEQPDGTYLVGYSLLGLKVGEDTPKPTAVTGPHRTIILDMN